MPPTSRCVVLVPVATAIDGECEDALRELERRGYAVWRLRGYSAIDAARNQMANDALAQGFDELMWIDDDIVFDPDDVDEMRRHDLPLVCGIYPKKACRQFACAFLPDTRQILFGTRGDLVEILYCGFGFVLTRRILYEIMQQKLGLAACNQRFQMPLVPYFTPLIAGEGEQAWLLSDDYSFCERARRCGFRIMADTTIRLWHAGRYRYGWEDAGRDVERFTDYSFNVSEETPIIRAAHEAQRSKRQDEPLTPLRSVRGSDNRGLHESIDPLPASFPRFRAYFVSYPANHDSLRRTLESFRGCDWGEEPVVFVQPEDWPLSMISSSRNYKRALEHAAADGCDFAVLLEDDVRVCKHLRANLRAIPLLRRDQCDYFSLFIPDLIASPWQREETHLGYRLARPLYSGPDRVWTKGRLWGAQGYVLSRRFILEALKNWDELKGGKDGRVLTLCRQHRLPLWYAAPCLVQHAPLRSVYKTPPAYAADFRDDFRFHIGPGFQPPEAIAGRLTVEEGRLLWELAAGRSVLELGTAAGRATVCLAQQAERVVTVDAPDQGEAREWTRRYGVSERVVFRTGEVEAVCRGLTERFELVFVNGTEDAEGLRRTIEALLPLVAPGGQIAFHDYPDPSWPDVRRIVDEQATRHRWQRVAQADYVGVFQDEPEA
jgi:protein-L-isoaspartate O-methyltransferase